VSIRSTLQATIARLTTGAIESPQPEAEWIVSDLLGVSRTDLFLRSSEDFPENLQHRLKEILTERLSGRPLQYILGYTEFYGRRFLCDDRALIPRPETEVLVETAVNFARSASAQSLPPLALDIGTGSGIIAISLAKELPEFSIVATDISPDALALARENATQLKVADRIQFLRTSLFDSLTRQCKFTIICANPPYVAPEDTNTIPTEVVDHEPHTALFAPEGGLSLLRTIIAGAGDYLASRGLLIMEIGYDQADRILTILDQNPDLDKPSILPDLAGLLRVATAVRI